MNIMKIALSIGFVAVLSGCAVGNKYDYQLADPSLPVKGSSKVSLGVVDNRDAVTSGEKQANFIGLQRGGFGNPFDVTTSSGKPLADDMSEVLSRSLKNSGYEVKNVFFSSPDSSLVAKVIKEDGENKNIVLTINEWKTDAFMNFALSYDLLLQILNANGEEIASASGKSNGKEILSGAGFEGQNSTTAASAFETKIGRLFNSPEIIKALSD